MSIRERDYKIFDSHAHYDDEEFNEDREKIIKEINENGVIGILNCGSSLEGSIASEALSEKYDFIYAAVGLHPEYADKLDDKSITILKDLIKKPKVRAIGEIGLDYHYEENPPREIQLEAFNRQMSLAEEFKLPVVIHDREAHLDTLNVMKKNKNVNGVVHCFSGGAEFAYECLKLGYYIGFTGVVTFKNAKKIIEVAKIVPLNRILVETDCPYMAPVPFRGKRNRSDYIENIIKVISEVKDISEEEISQETIKNTKNLLNI